MDKETEDYIHQLEKRIVLLEGRVAMLESSIQYGNPSIRYYYPRTYPPIDSNLGAVGAGPGCSICGIGGDGKAMGFVCSRPNCPTKVTC